MLNVCVLGRCKLEYWIHLKHQLPGSSERKYLKILEVIENKRESKQTIKIDVSCTNNVYLYLQFDVISRVHFKKTFFYEIDISSSEDKCDFETSSDDELSDDDLLAERM